MSQVIPSSWTSTELSNIVDFQNGFAFKSQWFVKSGKYQVLKLGNVKVSQLKLESSPAYVSEEIALEYKSYQPQKDDILITMTGTRFKRDYGFVCRVDQKVDALINQRVGRIRNNHDISDSKYLSYFLMSNSFQDEFFEGETGGVSQGNVGSKHILSCNLFLPPLAEQQVIADKLDELLAQVESTKARLDAIPAILKSFRQSVLAAAVSGKLTEEWRLSNPKVTSSKQLYGELKKLRLEAWEKENVRLRKKRKYKEALNDISDAPHELPKTWQWMSVDSLASKVSDGVHKKPEYVLEGIPFVTVKNLTKGKGISFDELNYVTQEDHDEFCKRTNPERGDILISKDGTLGVIRQVKTDTIFSIFVSVALVKPVHRGMSDYMELVFQSPTVQDQMVGVGTGLQHIHLTDLRKDLLPIPPIEEQTEIVRRVEALFAFADKVEAQVNTAQTRVNNLTQSILAKAFRGELTADWRAANPELICGENSAEALLKRIKAERESLAKATQTSKTKPIKNANSRKNT